MDTHTHTHTHTHTLLLCASVIKNLPANAGTTGDIDLIPGSGRSPGGGHGNPLQYSGLENPYGQRSLAGYKSMGSQSQTRLSN